MSESERLGCMPKLWFYYDLLQMIRADISIAKDDIHRQEKENEAAKVQSMIDDVRATLAREEPTP